ncbi:MAG: hypothetical protein M1834_006670 [Cirrosporium novae-zelandiae]|nr:MAG: hypothetical protein M1834_006670 [Cirrosporium novae-zelandiae]
MSNMSSIAMLTSHPSLAAIRDTRRDTSLMDRSASDFPQSDQASAAQYTPQPEVRSTVSSSATPKSEYNIQPPSARSGGFPEFATPQQQQQQQQQPPPSQQQYAPVPQHPNTAVGAMAQSTSPSKTLQDGEQRNHQNSTQLKSDPDVPIDPSIAQSSPTYPPPYSPYQPQGHELPQHQGYPPPQQMHQRADWPPQVHSAYPYGIPGPYGTAAGMPAGAPTTTAPPPRPGQVSSSAFGIYPHMYVPGPYGVLQTHPLSQVYSFVPIPGAQQHKRPRRRYEEIERMYKCGWNGCEKAYGTLNHLNAHVTMQAHGAKRTPEEFKEIRKEWKARKKEEENQRKQEEERQRAAAAAQAQQQVESQGADPNQNPPQTFQPVGVRQLPPIGYGPAATPQAPGQYTAPSDGMTNQMYQQGNGQVNYQYPHSPYTPQNQVYQQRW